MKWTIVLLAACCSWHPAVAAETAQERGKRVVNEALQALGGQAFLKMEDRVESGRADTFSREQLAGLPAPNFSPLSPTRPEPPQAGKIHMRERQAFGKDES